MKLRTWVLGGVGVIVGLGVVGALLPDAEPKAGAPKAANATTGEAGQNREKPSPEAKMEASAATPAVPQTGTNKGDVHVTLANGAIGDIFPERNENKRLRVTLVQFVDNAPSANQFTKPAAGKKFVAFEFLIENVGTAETAGLDWKLRDTGDFETGQSFTAGVGGPALPSTVLTPGGKVTGWVVFEIGQSTGVKWLRADPNPFLKNDLYFDAPAQ